MNSSIPIDWIGFQCAWRTFSSSFFSFWIEWRLWCAQVEINALDSLKTVRRYYLVWFALHRLLSLWVSNTLTYSLLNILLASYSMCVFLENILRRTTDISLIQCTALVSLFVTFDVFFFHESMTKTSATCNTNTIYISHSLLWLLLLLRLWWHRYLRCVVVYARQNV